MNNKYNSCKDCQRRKPLCHSTCPEYTKFREENLKRYEENKNRTFIKHSHKERVR